MDLVNDILHDMLLGAAYGAVGIALMIIGVWVIDLVTPGHLVHRITTRRSVNANIIVASVIVALAIVQSAVVFSTGEGFGRDLLITASYGLVGVLLLTIGYIIIEVLTPTDMRAIVMDEEFHPLAATTGIALVALGVILAVALY